MIDRIAVRLAGLEDPGRHSDAVMTNLIGEDAAAWSDLAKATGTAVTLYGKTEIRAGRKMGHVNRVTGAA